MNKLSEAKKILDEEINVRHMPTPVYRLYRNSLCLLSEHQQEYEKLKEVDEQLLVTIKELKDERTTLIKENERLREALKYIQEMSELNASSEFLAFKAKQALESEREGE